MTDSGTKKDRVGAVAPNLATRLALTLDEAAAALGISERHLRSLPDIPRAHLGGRVVVPLDLLRRWLSERARSERDRVDEAVDEVLGDLLHDE